MCAGSFNFQIDQDIENILKQCKILLIEGYLLELPEARLKIRQATNLARKFGTLIALNTGLFHLINFQKL